MEPWPLPEVVPDRYPVRADGYVGQVKNLHGRSGAELERTLGYGPGRLSDGWWLLLLTERPGRDDFEVHGSTLYPGGLIPAGSPRGAGQTFEDFGRTAIPNLNQWKDELVAAWPLSGPFRWTKLVPKRPGHDYPAASTPVLQLRLGKMLPFDLACFVLPGAVAPTTLRGRPLEQA